MPLRVFIKGDKDDENYYTISTDAPDDSAPCVTAVS